MLNNTFIKLIEKDIIAGDDGWYVWWPSGLNGGLNSSLLRDIAEYLDMRNKEWEDSVNKFFDGLDDMNMEDSADGNNNRKR